VGKLTHGNVTHFQIRLVFSTETGLPGWSERIRTRAFPIEPGLCLSFPEFGNMAGGPTAPFAANSGSAMENLPNSVSLNPIGTYSAGAAMRLPHCGDRILMPLKT
jgi:hypothetical protein